MAERLWPTLAELEVRRDATQRQIDARNRTLNGRWDRGEPVGVPTLFEVKAADAVLRNLHTRLETYDIDIVRMRQHSITTLQPNDPMLGGMVWACSCKATGTAPTAYTALGRYNEHVMQAVWGA